jgi:hypothetical protein
MLINVKIKSAKWTEYQSFNIEADDEEHAIYLVRKGQGEGNPFSTFTEEDRPYNITVKPA